MNRLLVLLFFMFGFVNNALSQILSTKNDIIEHHGTNYEEGYLEDGVYYLSYLNNTPAKAFYFSDYEGIPLVVTSFKIIFYIHEVNEVMTHFKKEFVEVDYMKFKDYKSHTLYKISTDDNYCIVDGGLDFTE